MKNIVLMIVILFAFPFVPKAQAAQFSGDYLIYICGVNQKGKELVPGGHTACQAYIAGVIDYQNMMRSMGATSEIDFCVPEGVSMYGLQRVVLNYLIKHRKIHGRFIATPAVTLALFELYPCHGRKTR